MLSSQPWEEHPGLKQAIPWAKRQKSSSVWSYRLLIYRLQSCRVLAQPMLGREGRGWPGEPSRGAACGLGSGTLGLEVADGLFPPALQTDGERRPDGRSCRMDGCPRGIQISQGPGQVNGRVWNWRLTDDRKQTALASTALMIFMQKWCWFHFPKYYSFIFALFFF